MTLSAEKQDDSLRVAVTDTGPGLAPEHHEVVFDQFRQVGDPMTDKPAGTGLGLAICKRIVEHLGGQIGVVSAPARAPPFGSPSPW